MEIATNNSLKGAIGRWKLAIWLPVILFCYYYELMPIFLFVVIVAGMYEIRIRSVFVTNWSVIAYFHLAGLCWLFIMPEKEIWFIVMVVIINDAFAYYGGSFLNFARFMRMKISTVSPNKTLGGLIYGVFGGILMAILLFKFYDYPPRYIWFAFLLCLAGDVGDLLESGFKRFCGIKDSGDGLFTKRLLCGHGGVYDRFDALAFVCHYWMIITLLKFN